MVTSTLVDFYPALTHLKIRASSVYAKAIGLRTKKYEIPDIILPEMERKINEQRTRANNQSRLSISFIPGAENTTVVLTKDRRAVDEQLSTHLSAS